jgi:gliding motility-associated-like protein
VGLIVDEDGCLSELKEKHIKVIPDLQIEVDIEEGCEPLIVEFIAITKGSVSDDNFTWDFGDGVSGKGKTTGHIYQNDGFYDVGLRIVSNEDCENYGLVEDMVKVYALPTVAFSPEPEERSIVNPEFSFQNNSENALTYTWDFGDTIGYSSDFEPTHRYKKMGWFDVKLLAESEFGCKDSAYQKVLVAFDQIFPPNAFSPNSADLVNQTFLPVNEEVLEAGYYLQVFNRWGERIFEAKDEFIGWDGKMKNGQFAPSGVYTWVVAYQDFIGRNHRQNGAVTLVF